MYLGCARVCLHMCSLAHAWVQVGGIFQDPVFSFECLGPGIRFCSSGLTQSTFTHRTISVQQVMFSQSATFSEFSEKILFKK